MSDLGNVRWHLKDGRVIRLLRPEEFKDLVDGTELISILGEKAVKGRDRVDDEEMSGFIAYGLLEKN